jgi:hypothetical protein
MKSLFTFTVILLLLSVSTISFAQENTRERGRGVFVEILGNGLIGSINYDQRFDKRFDGLGFKGGISYFAFNGSSVAAFPFGLNYLLGKDGKYFEMGLGATYLRFADSSNTFSVGNERTIGDGLAGNMIFGYRREPVDGGFLFRASMTPIFGSGTFFPFYFGISLGYAF